MPLIHKDAKILIDSDVIRHLIKGGRLELLYALYGKKLVLLDVVRDELMRSSQIQTQLGNFIAFYKIEVKDFPSDNMDILKEYARLKRRYGEGESACMAVARYQKNIIASSNLKDIKAYCEKYHITYLSTMDILLEAVDSGTISEVECDGIIQTIKAKNSKLPVDTIAEYRRM